MNIFIFRRDFRLIDNIGLNHAMKNFKNIIPIFIFTPEQVTDKNKYKSDNCIQFMIESLRELDSELKKNKSKLHLFYGDNIKVLTKICNKIKIDNIIFNMDYTPYAIKRDKQIQTLCKKKKINCVIKEDYLLQPIGTLNKKDGNPYTVFTPFKNNGMKIKILKPTKCKIRNLIRVNDLNSLTVDYSKVKYDMNSNKLVLGGRKEAIKRLNKAKTLKKYNEERNNLTFQTSLLSAYIKFGCVSIREVYYKLKESLGTKNTLLSQLFWREFYVYIAHYFPQVLKGKNYNEKYDKLKWTNSKTHFDKWCQGKTGYPIIDAGITEMNTTGYMHNRARLFTSNFLNRMLGQDWRRGEKYFAQKLTDYDAAINNGNWQWIASTGVDPKPYFQRLFNPWLQSQKFDPDAKYIKKWLPNLKNIPAKELHQWDKYCSNYDLKKLKYIKPIVNYKNARQKSVMMYRKVLK